MMYRDTYRIVTSVSRYVSYREVSVSLQAYCEAMMTHRVMTPASAFTLTVLFRLFGFIYF